MYYLDLKLIVDLNHDDHYLGELNAIVDCELMTVDKGVALQKKGKRKSLSESKTQFALDAIACRRDLMTFCGKSSAIMAYQLVVKKSQVMRTRLLPSHNTYGVMPLFRCCCIIVLSF